MLNQVVLVGRLTDDIEVIKTEKDKKVANITLAIQRPFKNEEGVYEADFIKCTLWNSIAENTTQYCHKGDVVGVKGRIQMDHYEDKEGNQKTSFQVIAEKVTFLSSRSEHDQDKNDDSQKTTKKSDKER